MNIELLDLTGKPLPLLLLRARQAAAAVAEPLLSADYPNHLERLSSAAERSATTERLFHLRRRGALVG